MYPHISPAGSWVYALVLASLLWAVPELSGDVLITAPSLELSPYVRRHGKVAVITANTHLLGGSGVFGLVTEKNAAGLTLTVAGYPDNCGPSRNSPCFGSDLDWTAASSGTFEVVLNGFGGSANALPSLTFTVTRWPEPQRDPQGSGYFIYAFVAQLLTNEIPPTLVRRVVNVTVPPTRLTSTDESGTFLLVVSGLLLIAAASLRRARRGRNKVQKRAA